MILAETPRLILRNWRDDDRDLFFRINSDEAVMRFFPFRRSRRQSDRLMERLRDAIAGTGLGFAALQLRQTSQCIGFAGLSPTKDIPTVADGTVEIGWRLAPEFWGNGYVTEAARALLRHGFLQRGFEEIVSFAVWNNTRSLAVMKRIGMKPDPVRDFDHPGVPATHPELKRHAFYCICRGDWQSNPLNPPEW